MTVLDFGCGPGGFSLAAANLVGPEGRVYAVDIHPLALEMVKRAARKLGIGNIKPILCGDIAEVSREIMDIVLLYDVLHDLQDPGAVLVELHRVLKPKGVLSICDHHLKDTSLVAAVTNGGFFRLVESSQRTFQFECY